MVFIILTMGIESIAQQTSLVCLKGSLQTEYLEKLVTLLMCPQTELI